MYSFIFIIPFLFSFVNVPNEEHSPPRPPNLNANNDPIQPQTTFPQNIDGRALGYPQGHHNISQGGSLPPPFITNTTPIVGSSSVVASGSGGGNEITMEDVANGSANVGMLPMKRGRDHMDYQDTSSSTSSSPPLDILVEQEHEWQQVIEPSNQEMHVEHEQQLEQINNNEEIVFPCFVCDRVFTSQRSMFGHMRCHGDREWRGAYPPPRFTVEQFEELIRRYDEIHHEANEQPPNVANDIDLNQPGNGDEDGGIDPNHAPPNGDEN